tara:strand:- start:829 stop:1092 length:264 start_codon:yes stop_codon:yes gene_type:complete
MSVNSYDVSIKLVVGKYWWYSGRPHNIWKCTELINGEYVFNDGGGMKLKVKKKKFDKDFHAWEEKWEEQWEQPQRRPPPASPACHVQ